MVKRTRNFRFSFGHLIRLIIFFVLVYLVISYLSTNKKNLPANDPTVLGSETKDVSDINLKPIIDSAYSSLPDKSRDQLQNLDKLPVNTFIQDKINFINSQKQGFPQKQIKALQIWIIKSVSEILIKKVDNTK